VQSTAPRANAIPHDGHPPAAEGADVAAGAGATAGADDRIDNRAGAGTGGGADSAAAGAAGATGAAGLGTTRVPLQDGQFI